MNRAARLLVALSVMVVAGLPARADIIFEQLPSNGYAAISDTDYYTNTYGPAWQLLAHDFSVSLSAPIQRITWWGCYGGGGHPIDPPPGDEYMRIRLYQPRDSDALPGGILYEQTILNVSRVATGRIVGLPGGPPEYRYQFDLLAPFEAEANTSYWLEIVQLGDVASTFRWEDSASNTDGLAVANPWFPDWTLNPPGVSVAFQLSNVPEPKTHVLATVAGALAIERGRRKRR